MSDGAVVIPEKRIAADQHVMRLRLVRFAAEPGQAALDRLLRRDRVIGQVGNPEQGFCIDRFMKRRETRPKPVGFAVALD